MSPPTPAVKTSVLRSLALALLVLAGVPNTRGAAVEFARDIEPILIKRCSECHGPDKQKAKLRLDSRAAAVQAGKSGHPAISPGRPEESELIKRVTTTDADDVMPPKGARLTEQEVAALKQ